MKVSKDDAKLPRCYFSHCTISNYTDQHRPPTKQQPFKAIIQHSPAHTVDLILPEELYTFVEGRLVEKSFSYARVYVSLLEIITGDFFNQYIKAGNVLMLSEGQLGVENTFSLKNSVLHLDIDKATYERCGLNGVAAAHPGRKHVKSRFHIDLDLRQPSMQHGKKGFERIKWAFKNVLADSLAWLFVDLENEDVASGPITALHPQVVELKPMVSRIKRTIPPLVRDSETIEDPLYQEQLLEWLGLLTLDSPRVNSEDTTDPYLCRYALPEAFDSGHEPALMEQDLVHLRWRGFGTAIFVRHIWLILKAAILKTKDAWFSMGAGTFDGTSITILCHDGQSVMLWECD